MEQIFSLGGRLSDPNMNPLYLATLVFVGANMKVYMPSTKDIFQRYLRKFSKNGKLLDADGLGLTDAPAPATGARTGARALNVRCADRGAGTSSGMPARAPQLVAVSRVVGRVGRVVGRVVGTTWLLKLRDCCSGSMGVGRGRTDRAVSGCRTYVRHGGLHQHHYS